MKLRSRVLVLLGAGFVLSVAVGVVVAWQMRAAYERDLMGRIWPASFENGVALPIGNALPIVLMLGDSRISEWTVPLADRDRFVNAGVNGATTAEVLSRTGDALRRYRPAAVVIEAGINDLKLLGLRPDLRAKVVETVRTNLAAIVEECRAAGCQVLLLTVWLPGEPDRLRRLVAWNRAVPEAVDEVNRGLLAETWPHGVDVVDLFADGSVRATYRDTLHLTPGTYRELTPVLEARLSSAAARPR